MESHWIVSTHGEPLGALRQLLARIWERLELDGMLAPLAGGRPGVVAPRLISVPAELSRVNPFIPLMTINSAQMVPELLAADPQANLGVILRPCELRALLAMQKRQGFSLERVLTITIDCLGTFPVEDFAWRAERTPADAPGSGSEAVTRSVLQFARQGGILEYRYRPACQFCITPAAHGADLNLGVLGLPVRQVLLVSTRNEVMAEEYGLPEFTDGHAASKLLAERERLLDKLEARHRRTYERLITGLEGVLPHNVNELLDTFDNCGACQRCMESCPICSLEFPQRTPTGRYEQREVMHWLVSCAGCGMCEQACPQDRPLAAVFTHLRQQLEVLLD